MIKTNVIRIPLMATAALLSLASCQSDKNEVLASGILKQNMDTLVKPGNDFDAYVNGGWMKKNEIAADKPSYGVSEILYEKSQEDVKKIIDEASKGKFADGSNEQKIGDFYNSYMDQKTRDAKGISPLKPTFDAIDAIKNYDELAVFFGKTLRSSGNLPFVLYVTSDLNDPTKYAVHSYQAGLGLPEREYYFLSDAKSKEIRSKYQTHVENMLRLAGDADAKGSAAKVIALETLIASKHMPKEETRDVTKTNNPFKVSDLKKVMPTFNWKAFLDNAGMQKADIINLTQLDYMKAADGIVKSTPIDVWKTWLKWNAIHNAGRSLTAEIDRENFNFYGKALSGMEKQTEQWRRGVNTVSGNLGEIIGEIYVKKHFSAEAKERMEEMVKNLLKAYEGSIKELTWMTPETKKEALDKLSKFMTKVGYPDKFIDYSKLKVVKGDLYGNLERSTEFEYNRQLEKIGKKVDRTEWFMTPQTVNAYYNPSTNEIVFPAAILQAPMFDITVDDAVNYGAIGAVIGHEIGHGFDDQGSGFDGDGKLRNWWTKDDHKAFEERTGALASQFDSFKVFPDLNVNGKYTLGENIGDLGGLSIALRAYKISLKGKPAPKIDGLTAEQRFFIGYGQSWMQEAREETLRWQVTSDPHSPNHFRVNGVVRNVPEWYEAFNVKPGDSLYLAPEKRVKIW